MCEKPFEFRRCRSRLSCPTAGWFDYQWGVLRLQKKNLKVTVSSQEFVERLGGGQNRPRAARNTGGTGCVRLAGA